MNEDIVIDSSGFYKLDSNELLHGPNFVLNQNYELRKENHETYSYPVDGWYWFNSKQEAKSFFGIVTPEDETSQF